MSKNNDYSIPTISEHSESLGDIKINHSVVASIVRLAAIQIDGVYAVGGSLVDGLAEIFSKKETDRGVRVSEDAVGDYQIELRVVLRFGVALAEVALKIQENVRAQVSKMTMKHVARVDVIIDGVKMDDKSSKRGSEPENDTSY